MLHTCMLALLSKAPAFLHFELKASVQNLRLDRASFYVYGAPQERVNAINDHFGLRLKAGNASAIKVAWCVAGELNEGRQPRLGCQWWACESVRTTAT